MERNRASSPNRGAVRPFDPAEYIRRGSLRSASSRAVTCAPKRVCDGCNPCGRAYGANSVLRLTMVRMCRAETGVIHLRTRELCRWNVDMFSGVAANICLRFPQSAHTWRNRRPSVHLVGIGNGPASGSRHPATSRTRATSHGGRCQTSGARVANTLDSEERSIHR